MKITTLLQAITESTNDNIPSGYVATSLYRGIAKSIEVGSVAKFNVRQDRAPRDTPLSATHLFNVGFEKKFGFPQIRARAVFCATAPYIAMSYTSDFDPCIVQLSVPSGAKVAYNPEVEDSIFELGSIATGVSFVLQKAYPRTYQKFMDALDEIAHTVNSNDAIKQAIQAIGAPVQETYELIVKFVVDQLSGYSIYSPGENLSGDAEAILFNLNDYYGEAIDVSDAETMHYGLDNY